MSKNDDLFMQHLAGLNLDGLLKDEDIHQVDVLANCLCPECHKITKQELLYCKEGNEDPFYAYQCLDCGGGGVIEVDDRINLIVEQRIKKSV